MLLLSDGIYPWLVLELAAFLASRCSDCNLVWRRSSKRKEGELGQLLKDLRLCRVIAQWLILFKILLCGCVHKLKKPPNHKAVQPSLPLVWVLGRHKHKEAPAQPAPGLSARRTFEEYSCSITVVPAGTMLAASFCFPKTVTMVHSEKQNTVSAYCPDWGFSLLHREGGWRKASAICISCFLFNLDNSYWVLRNPWKTSRIS